ncbi:hypothetical protein K501DRAFT_245343 [Backusella circina FSU 941]|nr:hypothetical protein K501DRAFT_245343 [Backusella circina FSU 941]
MQSFQEELEDPSDARIIQCQNTYFMDGGAQFISLPSLGNSNTKLTLPLSQVFEEWLANKLYCSNETVNIPILEDNVELLAEDIMNQVKMRGSLLLLKGYNILVKIRADHIYTYHQHMHGQPLITQDMEDFFQQFPLFVEIMIYTIPHLSHETKLLLTVQNTTCYEPYCIMETT